MTRSPSCEARRAGAERRRPRRRARGRECRADCRAARDSGPRRCSMSAPLRPAARTRTSTCPAPGSGSGCSSTRTSPSRIVAARTGAQSRHGRSGATGVLGSWRDDARRGLSAARHLAEGLRASGRSRRHRRAGLDPDARPRRAQAHRVRLRACAAPDVPRRAPCASGPTSCRTSGRATSTSLGVLDMPEEYDLYLTQSRSPTR